MSLSKWKTVKSANTKLKCFNLVTVIYHNMAEYNKVLQTGSETGRVVLKLRLSKVIERSIHIKVSQQPRTVGENETTDVFESFSFAVKFQVLPLLFSQ